MEILRYSSREAYDILHKINQEDLSPKNLVTVVSEISDLDSTLYVAARAGDRFVSSYIGNNITYILGGVDSLEVSGNYFSDVYDFLTKFVFESITTKKLQDMLLESLGLFSIGEVSATGIESLIKRIVYDNETLRSELDQESLSLLANCCFADKLYWLNYNNFLTFKG